MVFQNNQGSCSSSYTRGAHWRRMVTAVPIPLEVLRTGLPTPCCSAEFPGSEDSPAPVLCNPL